MNICNKKDKTIYIDVMFSFQKNEKACSKLWYWVLVWWIVKNVHKILMLTPTLKLILYAENFKFCLFLFNEHPYVLIGWCTENIFYVLGWWQFPSSTSCHWYTLYKMEARFKDYNHIWKQMIEFIWCSITVNKRCKQGILSNVPCQ